MTELAHDRDAISEALGGDEDEHQEEDNGRDELERRRRALSPEALAGDEAALAELDQVEAQLAELDRRERLRDLAEAEQADRARQAAEVEAQRQRKRWQREKTGVEAKRDAQLLKIERAIGTLVDLIPQAIDLDVQADALGKSIDAGYHQVPARREIVLRVSRRLREIGLSDLPPVWASEGMEPLAVAKPRRRGRRA